MVSTAEISRKLIHLTNLVIPFGYIYIVPDRIKMTLIMVVVSIIFVIVDLARIRVGIVHNIFKKLFSFMMREHELDGRFTGATWVVLVSIPVIYFFPKDIAVLSFIYMSVGDTAAAIVGQACGRIKIGKKSLEGTFACLVVCIISALIVDLLPLPVSISGAVGAAVFEVLPINIDDNVLIPFGAGTTMILVSSFII